MLRSQPLDQSWSTYTLLNFGARHTRILIRSPPLIPVVRGVASVSELTKTALQWVHARFGFCASPSTAGVGPDDASVAFGAVHCHDCQRNKYNESEARIWIKFTIGSLFITALGRRGFAPRETNPGRFFTPRMYRNLQ